MPTPKLTIVGQPPPWMVTLRAFIGLRETPGPATTPAIHKMLAQLHAWWDDDEAPWCGTALAYCMEDAGLVIPKAWYRARKWAEWGRPLMTLAGDTAPQILYHTPAHSTVPYGAVCVLERGGGGHVTTYVAPVRDRPDQFWGLGANQGDMVKVSAFPIDRVLAVRWPSDFPMTEYRGSDVAAIARGELSRGEA